jgi:uncharacterized protein (TIGR00369 family)
MTEIATAEPATAAGRSGARVLRGQLPPIARTLGLTLVALEPGRSVVALEVDPERHANPMGTLHGGVLCDLADLAMGAACAATLGEGESLATVELTMNFLRPVWEGRLTATGRLVQAGRSLGPVERDITDAAGRLVARAKSTFMTLRGEQADGRAMPSKAREGPGEGEHLAARRRVSPTLPSRPALPRRPARFRRCGVHRS